MRMFGTTETSWTREVQARLGVSERATKAPPPTKKEPSLGEGNDGAHDERGNDGASS